MFLLFSLLLFSCSLMAMDTNVSGYASLVTRTRQSNKKTKQSNKKAAEGGTIDAEFASVLYEAGHLINGRSGLYKREGRAPEPVIGNQEEAMGHKKEKHKKSCDDSVLPSDFLTRLHQSYSENNASDTGLPQLEEAKDEKEDQPEAQQPPCSPQKSVHKRNRVETREPSGDCTELKRSRSATHSDDKGHEQLPDELLEILSKLQIKDISE